MNLGPLWRVPYPDIQDIVLAAVDHLFPGTAGGGGGGCPPLFIIQCEGNVFVSGYLGPIPVSLSCVTNGQKV